MSDASLDEICAVAIAEAFRGDGEILVSPMGPLPQRGARLAKATFEPRLVLTDGEASVVDLDGRTESWMPYREVFHTLWWGRRHVMMGASQIDQYGNQNISCIGSFRSPKVQLLGARGAPGNTIHHTTSYFVPHHSSRIFVPRVDFVSGVGHDRIANLGSTGRFHEIRRVISDLGVFDFNTPDRRMRVVSVHPGISLDRVVEQTGFELIVEGKPAETRLPTEDELQLLRGLLA